MLLFSVTVFSNLFNKDIHDTSRGLEDTNWNPRAVNSYSLIRHLANNFTSCLLLVLISDVIWLFLLIMLIVFQNSQHHSSWKYNNVDGRKWDFDELNEVLSWIDSSLTHIVVYRMWQGVKYTARAYLRVTMVKNWKESSWFCNREIL